MRSITGKLYKRVSLFTLSLILAISGLGVAAPVFLAQTAAAITTQPNYAAFDGVGITPVGTNSYTISSDITATDIGNNTVKLTGDAPIVTPWFGQSYTIYNYVTIGIKLPTDFAGTPSVYQTGIIRNDSPYNGVSYKMSTIGDGSTPLATEGAALGYLDYSFAANSNNTKKDGLVKLQVIWNANSTPEYYTIDITDLHLLTPAETAAPRVAITSPTLNQAINGRIVTIKGTATDTDFNYYYCYVSNVNGHEYGTRDASCTTTWHAVETAGTLGTVTLPNDLPDGNYVAHLIAYDKAGNSKETTQPFMLDNAAPVQPVFTAPVNDLFTKTNFVTLTWTNGDDSGLNQSGIKGYIIRYTFVPMDGGATVEWTSGIITNGNPKTHSGTYGHGQGTYTMYVSTVDNAGNVSPESNPLVLSYDATAPVAAITAPTVAAVSGHTLNIEGTATDANFNYYYCYVTNANGEVGIRDPQCTTAWSAGSPFHSAFAATVTGTTFGHLGTVDLTGLSSGTYQVHIVAYDKAGNSTEATPVLFTLDNTVPVIALQGASPQTIERGTSYNDNELGATVSDNTDSGLVATIDASNVNTLVVGTYTVKYDAVDIAGNHATQVTRTVNVVDTTDPIITITVSPPAEVLGATTDNKRDVTPSTTGANNTSGDSSDGEVKGDSIEKATTLVAVTPSNNENSSEQSATNGNIFGLAWYWWLAILAALAAGLWAITAYRHRGEKEA